MTNEIHSAIKFDLLTRNCSEEILQLLEVASLVDQRFTCKTKCVTDIESIKTLVHTEGAAMYPGLPPSSTSDISIQPPAKKKKANNGQFFQVNR